jgi:hypothetical protein
VAVVRAAQAFAAAQSARRADGGGGKMVSNSSMPGFSAIS